MNKSQVIENFLSDNELFEIEKEFRYHYDTKVWIEGTEHEMQAHSHYWYPGPSYAEKLCSYLNSKIQLLFPNNTCDNWHILNAFKPYGIHTDSLDDEHDAGTHSLPDGYRFGWTFLIPLADFDTNTIIFNEGSDKMKVSTKWIEKENRTPQNVIDDETREQYLSHQGKDIVDYFSIERVFPWKKGTLLAMDRSSFHCSDNFIKKNVLEKRALIGWSLIKVQ